MTTSVAQVATDFASQNNSNADGGSFANAAAAAAITKGNPYSTVNGGAADGPTAGAAPSQRLIVVATGDDEDDVRPCSSSSNASLNASDLSPLDGVGGQQQQQPSSLLLQQQSRRVCLPPPISGVFDGGAAQLMANDYMAGGKCCWQYSGNATAAAVIDGAPDSAPAAGAVGGGTGGGALPPCFVPFLPPWSQVVCYPAAATAPPQPAATCFYYPTGVMAAAASPPQQQATTAVVNGTAPSSTAPSPLAVDEAGEGIVDSTNGSSTSCCLAQQQLHMANEVLEEGDAHLNNDGSAATADGERADEKMPPGCQGENGDKLDENDDDGQQHLSTAAADGQQPQPYVASSSPPSAVDFDALSAASTAPADSAASSSHCYGESRSSSSSQQQQQQQQQQQNAQLFLPGTYQSNMATMTPVYVHVNLGQTLSLRVGDQIQYIPGPATVRMVSEQNPPLPMSMNVPPGHVVQQIVDENGTLRHIILSTPMPSSYPPPPPSRHPPTPGQQPQFTSPPPPPPMFYSGTGADLYACRQNGPYRFAGGGSVAKFRMVHRYDRRRGVGGSHHQQHHYVPPPPPPLHGGGMREVPPPPLPAIHYDGGGHVAISNNELMLLHHQQQQQHQQAATTSGAAMEEREEVMKIVEMMCNMQPPEVCEVGIREALARWQPLDCSEASSNGGPFPQLDASEFSYELTLWPGRTGDGKPIGQYHCAGGAGQQWLFALKPGTDYSVRLRAVLPERGLQGDPTAAVQFRTKPTLPDRPSPPRLAQRMKTSLMLRWTAPNDNGSKIVAYHLEMEQPVADDQDHPDEPRRSAQQFVQVYSGPLRQFKAVKLQQSTGYRFRLAASNGCGQSDYSDVYVAFTSGAAPAQPVGPPQLVAADCTSLTLCWPPGTDADEYQVQMEDPQTKYGFLSVAVTGDCQCVVDNLQRCKQYRFRLVAFNEDGQSPPSEVAVYQTAAGRPQPPSVPAVAPGGRALAGRTLLQWAPPADTGGCPIDEYQLELCEATDVAAASCDQPVTDQWRTVYTGSQTEFGLTKLRPGATYACRVACSSVAGGRSAPSDRAVFTVAPVVPSAPRGLCIVGKVKSTGAVVRWEEPEEHGGAQVTGYQLELTQQEEEKEHHHHQTPVLIYDGPKCEYHVQSLSPGQWYELRCRSANAAGLGQWSDVVKFRTTAACPDSPHNLRCVQSTCSSLTLAWDAPFSDHGSPVIEYRLFRAHQVPTSPSRCASAGSSSSSSSVSRSATSSPKLSMLAAAAEDSSSRPSSTPSAPAAAAAFEKIFCGNSATYEVRSLAADTQYAFYVQAVNGVGTSPASGWLLCRTQPGPPGCPADVVAEPLSLTQIQVSWTEPACNGSPVVAYNVDVSPAPWSAPDSGGQQLPVLLDAGQLCYVLTELQPDSAYRIRVRARNNQGWGAYTAALRVQTLAPPPRPPALELAAVGHNFVKLKWSLSAAGGSEEAGSSSGGGGRQYVVEMENRSGGFSPVYEGVARSCKVSRLAERTVYKFRIRVVCRLSGAGPWSDAFPFRTGRTPPGPLKSAVRVVDVTETTAMLEWPPVKMVGADLLTYSVELCETTQASRLGRGHGEDVRLVSRLPSCTYTFTNLHPGVTYSARVCAVRLCSADDDEAQLASADDLVEVPGPTTTAIFTTSTAAQRHHHHHHRAAAATAAAADCLSSNCRGASLAEVGGGGGGSGHSVGRVYRGLTDNQFAWVILIGFTVVAAIIAYVIDKVIAGN